MSLSENTMKKPVNKTLIVCTTALLTITFLVSLVVVLLYAGVIRYNSTPSLRYGLYIKVPGKLKQGSYVLLDNPRPQEVNAEKIIKRIDHFEGEKAYLKGDNTNEIFKRTGVKGIYSFDSDFFGLVEKASLTKLIPLLTWNKPLN